MNQRHLRTPASRIDSRILIVFVALALIVLGFAALASEVSEGDTLAFDAHILHALRNPHGGAPLGPKWLAAAMLDVTSLGSPTVLTLITIAAVGYLAAARQRRSAGYIVAAVAGGAALSTLLKHLFARARPDVVPHLVAVSSASFPSSHALDSAVVYLTLGALVAKTQANRHLRIYILSAAMGVSVLVGLSRIFLGVHWPSDLLAGWLVGGAWALLCSAVFEWLPQAQARHRGRRLNFAILSLGTRRQRVDVRVREARAALNNANVATVGLLLSFGACSVRSTR